MSAAPATRYARSGDVHIAYQATGDRPIDLLLIPDGVIPIEAVLEEPSFARFLERLETFARVIRFDRRGMGLSDPVPPTDPPTLERWAQDAEAVLDAAGSKEAALVGMAEGGFVATLLAATRPERARALVLIQGTPGFVVEPFASGAPAQAIERYRAGHRHRLGRRQLGHPAVRAERRGRRARTSSVLRISSSW